MRFGTVGYIQRKRHKKLSNKFDSSHRSMSSFSQLLVPLIHMMALRRGRLVAHPHFAGEAVTTVEGVPLRNTFTVYAYDFFGIFLYWTRSWSFEFGAKVIAKGVVVGLSFRMLRR